MKRVWMNGALKGVYALSVSMAMWFTPQAALAQATAASLAPEPAMAASSGLVVGREAPLMAEDPKLEARLVDISQELRCMVCQNESLAPAIKSGKRIVIAAHGNSIRALIKYLDGISDQDIVGLNIPNGIPLVYELDENLKPIRHYYLGDAEAAAKAAAAVATQGKA